MALTLIQEKISQQYQRKAISTPKVEIRPQEVTTSFEPDISVLFQKLDNNQDYLGLSGIQRVYLPISHFLTTKYQETIHNITATFPTYLYLPIIVKDGWYDKMVDIIEKALAQYSIKGFVLSNLSHLSLLEKWKDYEKIANFSLNIFNNQTCDFFSSFDRVILSPELNKENLSSISCLANTKKEIMVYGRIPLMHSNYCLLGNSNHCYANCKKQCQSNHTFSLKDRLGFQFPVVPDPTQTITTIYNSKITSISPSDIPANSFRIDFLEEDFWQMQSVLSTVREGKRLEGKEYTNGNLNREV